LQVIHAEAVAFAYEGIREAFVREASGHSSKVFPGYNETLESQNVVPIVHQLYSLGVRSGHIAHAHACTCFKYRKKKLQHQPHQHLHQPSRFWRCARPGVVGLGVDSLPAKETVASWDVKG